METQLEELFDIGITDENSLYRIQYYQPWSETWMSKVGNNIVVIESKSEGEAVFKLLEWWHDGDLESISEEIESYENLEDFVETHINKPGNRYNDTLWLEPVDKILYL